MAIESWPTWIRELFGSQGTFILSLLILALGLVLAYTVWRGIHSLASTYGFDDAVEGTPFERWARSLGTSTIGIVAQLGAIFVYIAALIVALNIAQLLGPELFWARFTGFLPRLFTAAIAIIVGLIAGDKASLVVSERLRSIKLPEVELIPELVRYSIYYIAGLVAMAELGVATSALLVLLAAYAFGLVFLTGIACKDLLAAGAAGVYLLLAQPYSIGDEIRIDDRRGIVQEVDMLVTHIESDEEEYIVPNQAVFRSGVVRIRQ